VSELLAAARGGEAERIGAVFAAVYPELKRMASRRTAGAPPGSTITTTVLVHETFLKMAGARDLPLVDRRHFFACAARAMRQILVDHARAAMAGKRGGGAAPVELPEEIAAPQTVREPAWLDLDRALDELDEVDRDLRELVELRFFAGLTREETAELLGRSERTVQRDWQRARAFLYARLDEAQSQ
jgi:RNA polymerase sigma factor (TIGR02999 family)